MRNGRRHQNALKHWCFKALIVPLKGFSSAANRGEESEKNRLENTVWSPYHWGQNYYIPFVMFWRIIFGNYYRKLYSM